MLFLQACDQQDYNPKEFQLVAQQANVFMVYVTGAMAKGRSKNVFASQDLCDKKGMVECEVYSWKERAKVPQGLPLTNDHLPFYGHYTRDKFGRETFSCNGCYDKKE
ncbi:MAG: hypothetical protein EB060_09200 [Proteobacteria bacterium]|nr:hypothetical protein [Pseudomonadota bacterium]